MFKFTQLRSARRFSNFVSVYEVGPRDGLQNEPKILPTATKVDFINKLSESGLKRIEVTAFVSAQWIPQMGDNEQVVKNIDRKPGITYSVLIPNVEGLQKAIDSGSKEVAIFAAASESFSRKNINCSVATSLKRFALVTEIAKEQNIKVRGYISCIAGCPYEGDVKPLAVASLASSLLELGCYEISLGDTVGVGTPKQIKAVLNELRPLSSSGNFEQFAVHCHDTYGQALANVYACLDLGVRTFDSSVGGLGGCPYAPGASGNLASEDLVYFLNGLGLESGVDLNKLVNAGDYVSNELGKGNRSKAGVALLGKMKREQLAN